MGIARSTYYDQPRVAHATTPRSSRPWGRYATSSRPTAGAVCKRHCAIRASLVNHKKIRRLMREHDLQPRVRRRFVATTDSDHDLPDLP